MSRILTPAAAHDLELTCEAMRQHGWEIVRLRGRSKKPAGKQWQVTTSSELVRRWVLAGDNIGGLCHERTGLAVLDPDLLEPWADMVDTFGQPAPSWVLTGSGRLHYYIQWTPSLPAKLVWRGQIIGEIQRGPGQQQVVLPPSIHPDTGRPYAWITDALGVLCEPINPAGPLPALPWEWWGLHFEHRAFERELGYAHDDPE
jgi:hypothetical protein